MPGSPGASYNARPTLLRQTNRNKRSSTSARTAIARGSMRAPYDGIRGYVCYVGVWVDCDN